MVEWPKRKSPTGFLKAELKRSWWVLAFCLAAFSTYLAAVKGQNKQIFEYQSKLGFLKEENQKIALENEDLQLRINSQSDPAWIELILMKELGVVPEGKLKVHFTHQK